MHHNRSLLPNVEVLLGVMVKTSKCNTKLLFVILHFYSWFFRHNFDQISEFQPNIRISTKFQYFNQISEFQPNFRMLTKFLNLTKLQNVDQILEFQPDSDIFTKFMNFYQVSADQWLSLHKFQNHFQCCLTRHFKIVKKGGSGQHFYDPEVGMLLRSFGNGSLIWTLLRCKV